MSNAFSDSVGSDALYPDDLPGAGRIHIVGDRPVPADDVPLDDAQFGMWTEIDDDQWMASPAALREALGHAIDEHGSTDLIVEIVRAERDDEEDHNPWQIDMVVHSVDGTKLEDAPDELGA